MTLQVIIDTLSKQGINSKGQVLNALKTANIKELQELRRSITEEIVIREIKSNGRN